ncbi:hypothetical protein LTR56_006180 [Elasticomyces elasticus]|nr:hypothetical protein LTR56_006180 [Elasticomyces elasticus]KAK3666610.1 hypothetical protein LTR22_002554 [Elasticomyces elasticus]KAK4928256.1 hypothetical protein LTR49_004933 [Elasticomyces elasticus]KAK5763819.1 hypothetical protein LTS12_005937 [Elasticomyces elasticus]
MPSYESINLHPDTHRPSSLKTTTYDVVVFGTGWAGRIAAYNCAAAGLSVLTIEKELIGGDCPFWACLPTKALLRPNEALEEVRRVRGAREKLMPTTSCADSSGVDVDAVFTRRDRFCFSWDDTAVQVPNIEGNGCDIVRGVGRLVGVRVVRITFEVGGSVEEVKVQARFAVVMATGSEPVVPGIPGLAAAKPWTNREASSSSIAPESLFIIGGGVVGVEMATIYQSFGSKIILASRSDELLPAFDSEAGKMVRERLVSRGAHVLTSASVTKVTRKDLRSPVVVTVTGADGTSQEISAAEILVAAGRRAGTTDLGLDSVGVNLEAGQPFAVDDSLLVRDVPSHSPDSDDGGPWLYAAGDANGRAILTHNAKYHGRICASAIIARLSISPEGQLPKVTTPESPFSTATGDGRARPQVIFSDPQVATVGLMRRSAAAACKAIRTATVPVWLLAADLHAEELEDPYRGGWAQWVIEEGSGVLLGATFVGAAVAELLHPSTVAIVGRLTVEQLVHAIPPFPTMSELYLNLVEAALVETIPCPPHRWRETGPIFLA